MVQIEFDPSKKADIWSVYSIFILYPIYICTHILKIVYLIWPFKSIFNMTISIQILIDIAR
jgi:hypothetical protein